MAGRIPQAFIDDLLERADIVEIIDARLSLRKTGRNYSALCPFHNEKTPSFSVNPDKQFYYCFGCGAGGNALGFLMEYERQDFPQAAETLAHHLGMEVPREESIHLQQSTKKRKSIHSLLERASQYYCQQLKEQSSSKAVTYLKQRSVSGEIAKRFQIGFAPPGWDNILRHLGHNDNDRQLLIDSGMLIEKDDGSCYDRFRDRIMFPIRDMRGRIVAFGGRVLGDDKPKYLNSPETSVFQKSHELYGLHEARQSNRRLDHILIVEGYMDVVALAQHDIQYACATLGTATSETHMEKVFRLTPKVIFCFDGDKAGRQAADRALETCLPLMQDGRHIAFLFLPEGEDPDSLVQKIGRHEFEKKLDQAQPLSEYLFEKAGQGLNAGSMDDQARLSKQAIGYIQRLPDGVFKALMFNKLAERTGLDKEQLETLGRSLKKTARPPSEPGTQRTPADHPPHTTPSWSSQQANNKPPSSRNRLSTAQQQLRWSPVRRAIMLLLNYPALANELEFNELKNTPAHDPELELLLELTTLIKFQPDSSCYHLLGHWMGSKKGELLTQLLAAEHNIDQEGAKLELQDCISHFGAVTLRQSRAALIQQLSQDRSLTFAQLNDEQKRLLGQIGNTSKNTPTE